MILCSPREHTRRNSRRRIDSQMPAPASNRGRICPKSVLSVLLHAGSACGRADVSRLGLPVFDQRATLSSWAIAAPKNAATKCHSVTLIPTVLAAW